MKNFEYVAPGSLDEAFEVLNQRSAGVRFLAGGTDIIVQLREGLLEADLVVDVKKIPELMAVSWSEDGGLRLGASVPCSRIHRDRRLAAAYPALADAARIIGGWQIQSRASIGGNLCNASPAADSIPALLAHGATCHVAGPGGRRRVAVEAFCTGPGRTALGAGEFLVELEFPRVPARSSSRYLRFIPRNEMDIAVVGAGAWLKLDDSGERIEDARIALAAVGPTPVMAAEAAAFLRGREAGEEAFERAGELARKAASPISDKRGPAEYRRHLVGVLTRRALSTALERATS